MLYRSLGFTVSHGGELLLADPLKGASDIEGSKARFIRWRVRGTERYVAELAFRPSGISSSLQVTT
jgi:hypothetical protein